MFLIDIHDKDYLLVIGMWTKSPFLHTNLLVYCYLNYCSPKWYIIFCSIVHIYNNHIGMHWSFKFTVLLEKHYNTKRTIHIYILTSSPVDLVQWWRQGVACCRLRRDFDNIVLTISGILKNIIKWIYWKIPWSIQWDFYSRYAKFKL